MRLYRVCCAEIEAENPYQAIMYFLGRIDDPNLKDLPLDWIVIDIKAKKAWKIEWSIQAIDAEARTQLDATIEALGKPPKPRRRRKKP